MGSKSAMTYRVAAFYRFTALADITALKAELLAAFVPLDLCGTLLLAPEGINGTLAGLPDAIARMLDVLSAKFGLALETVKFSEASDKPFRRLKIRLKKEIITFGQNVDPQQAGTYVTAAGWNALLDDPDVLVLDTRNIYETLIGTFAGARDPKIGNFTEFAAYARAELASQRHRKIAMYCTGGIRCEKASAFMRAEGFDTVYHLQGGILKYLETVPPEQSKWQGDCYVFDRRMAVGHGLAATDYTMCYSCGYPLGADDRRHQLFEDGVSCSYCHATTSNADKARFRMRHRQIAAGAIPVNESSVELSG